MQAKFEECKEAFIEQIKSNLKEIFKDEIREIITEELSDLEKVSSTVNLLQKHVSSLKEINIALQKKCSDLELSIDNNGQHSRRTCLRISNIPCEEKETSEEVLKKVKKLINEEAEVGIPEEKPLIELIVLVYRKTKIKLSKLNFPRLDIERCFIGPERN